MFMLNANAADAGFKYFRHDLKSFSGVNLLKLRLIS